MQSLTFKNVNLSTIPLSSLPKDMAFPPKLRALGAARQEQIDKMTLPRIVAVKHDASSLSAVRAMVSQLPRGSKIGLEVGLIHDCNKHTLKFYQQEDYFLQVAELARKANIEVVWLERRLTRYSSRARFNLRELESNLEQRSKVKQGSQEFIDLLSKRERIRGELRKDPPYTSEWRSLFMTRAILRRSDWRSTDVVLCGSAHAVNISTLLNRSIDTFIGNYQSADALKFEIDVVMRGQVAMSARMQLGRSVDKVVRKLKKMISIKH